MTPSRILLLAAVVCFVLAAFGIIPRLTGESSELVKSGLVDIGLALGFASFLVR